MRMENGAAAVEDSLDVSEKLHTELPQDPKTPFLCTYTEESTAGALNEYLYSHVQSSIIQNSQKVGATQVHRYRLLNRHPLETTSSTSVSPHPQGWVSLLSGPPQSHRCPACRMSPSRRPVATGEPAPLLKPRPRLHQKAVPCGKCQAGHSCPRAAAASLEAMTRWLPWAGPAPS